jgi:putative spermidine/putrescine transport system permease protein
MTATHLQRPRMSPAALAAWLCVLFLLLPILVVAPFSVTPHRYLSFPTDGLSLRHYQALLEGAWLRSIGDSLIVALGATALAVLLGASLAIAIWRLPGRLPRAMRVLALAPLIVPGIIHALGYYRALAYFGLLDTYAGIILVHGLKAMPFVFISVTAVLLGLNQNLDQAAQSLGASQWQAIRLVVLPNITGGLLSGAFLAFITSWDEVVVAIFITGRNVHTLPKLIWESLVDNLDPAVAALATIMIAATASAVIWRELVKKPARHLRPHPSQES